MLMLSQEKGMLTAYFSAQQIDTQAIGRKLLGRDVPERAAKKTRYVMKQMNLTFFGQETRLMQMKNDEKEAIAKQHKEKKVKYYRNEWKQILDILGDEIHVKRIRYYTHRCFNK